MAKRLTMLLAGLFLVIGTALADDRFSGVVTASDTGEPILGATVKVVGTTLCTVADLDGKFLLMLLMPLSQKLATWAWLLRR